VKRNLAILLSNLALVACSMSADAQGSGDRRSEAGPPVSRSFELAGFDAIGLAGSQDVEVRVGGGFAVRAEGDAEMIERLDIRVEDGTLKIGHKRGNYSIGWSRDRPKTRIFVSLPAIRAASLAGSGDLRIDRVQGDRFEASLAGSGDIEIGQIQVADLAAKVAGSGNIKAAGSAQSAEISVAGSGDVDIAAVQSRTASASVVGSGDARIQASETANVSIAGSGDVWVTGTARCTVSKRGSGTVHCNA
jgi:hypothetical protein